MVKSKDGSQSPHDVGTPRGVNNSSPKDASVVGGDFPSTTPISTGNYKGAKIAWSDIILPKKEGGLGIKNLFSWNTALMITHLWTLIYGTNKLWATWIKAYHLKGSNLWKVKAPQTCFWNLRKLIHLRPIIRPLIQHFTSSDTSTY
ncbi:hypothetical protein Dsin_005601 [Dipteronia sinensis]|uniref:Uncharacterized protein n=1 Tax=Dipteronia sinensis TaxID=43782 RepID=A0AAE0AY73_9ROSI|nr:hypothetical protein Dsin_005601 [Dipteronia sinensis]